MFEAPGRPELKRVVVNHEVINGLAKPTLFARDGASLNWGDNGTLTPAA
jgi:hypothetical protein